MVSYTIENGEELHREFPDTFELPPLQARTALFPGDIVKLIFRIEHDDEIDVERMWVVVEKRTPHGYEGVLDNNPYCTSELRAGAVVVFGPEHVIQIYED